MNICYISLCINVSELGIVEKSTTKVGCIFLLYTTKNLKDITHFANYSFTETFKIMSDVLN